MTLLNGTTDQLGHDHPSQRLVIDRLSAIAAAEGFDLKNFGRFLFSINEFNIIYN